MEARTELVNSQPLVNRWLVDYYLSLALEFFQKQQYADFRAIRRLLESALVLPLNENDSMRTGVRVLQLLSRINEDTSFESDQSVSPLESAFILLEQMKQECNIPQQDFEKISSQLTEMIIKIFIKNGNFEKAREMLATHIHRQRVSLKGTLLSIITQKNKSHILIEQMDFKQFKEDMLAFCRKLYPFNMPFLHKAATQLSGQLLPEPDDKVAEEEEEPGPSGRQLSFKVMPCKDSNIHKTRLKEAYQALAAGVDGTTMEHLEEEIEREEQPKKDNLNPHILPTPNRDSQQAFEQDGLFQRDSNSPMEASPADQPPHTDTVPETQTGSETNTTPVLTNRLYSVAQLVVEPDSQVGLQCTTPSQEPEIEVVTEQPQVLSSKEDQQDPVTVVEVTIPTWKRTKQACKISSRNSSSEHVQKPEQLASNSPSKDAGNRDEIGVPRTSSTPHKDSTSGSSHSNWKQLYNDAVESKETWSDEELYFNSKRKRGPLNGSTGSTSKKRMWTESETNNLIEGVKRYGEGNWSKIKAHYSFKDRTNINLKDRWRTIQKNKI